MAPLRGEAWCWNHHPTNSRARAVARRRGGQNRRRVVGDSPKQLELRSAATILALLELAVRGTLAQENSLQRSRTLGYLAGQALKAIEVGELEQRLEAMESVLGARRKV